VTVSPGFPATVTGVAGGWRVRATGTRRDGTGCATLRADFEPESAG